MRNALIGALLMVLVAAASLTAGFALYADAELDRIAFYQGTVIDEIDVSGMTRDEALSALSVGNERRGRDTVLFIRYDGNEYAVTGGELGVAGNLEDVVDEAWYRYRSGRFLERVNGLLKLRAGKGIPLKTSPVYPAEAVDAYAGVFASRFYTPPADATMALVNGAFVFTDERLGMKIDEDALANAMRACLAEDGSDTIHANVEAIEPAMKRSVLERSVHLLAQVSTKLPEEAGRADNIALIAKNLSGAIIGMDEDFSINTATGERTEDKGYKRVPISGQSDDNGVGQFAATFYRCALLAGMDVVERERQAAPAAYLPIGFDAAVEWGGKDLVMRNATGAALYLDASIADGELCVALYGVMRDRGASIKLVGEVVETVQPPESTIIYDAVMREGERMVEVEPRTGYSVNTYRQFFSDGELKREERLSSDYYPAVRGRERVGTLK